MKRILLPALLLLAGSLFPEGISAQLSSNPDKFLGNITTSGSVNGGGIEFATLWNQLTPENESKWKSIEGTRGRFNWYGCDNCYNYCKKHGIPFKFHTLIWGSQYPKWMDNLSASEQYEEIVKWMDAVKERYPDIDMIDVVNEAIPGHAPAPYKDALGGDGVTGYDWIVKAFDLAAERWPDAILIYNDYNTFQWQKSEFINLVRTIRDAGAPIDAYGCQSHDLTDIGFGTFKSAMAEIQDALQMPMYSSEYDIGTPDDAKQKTQYSNQIKYMWEQPYVAGITLWGYIYGRTWTSDGNSGIIKNGKDRPAMTWLREYMATDAAKTAVSPFKGYAKEASVYIRPSVLRASVGIPCDVDIQARLRTKTIDHIDFYIDGQLAQTLTQAPYVVQITPDITGTIDLKAMVYDTDGGVYPRLGSLNVYEERKPFGGSPIEIPGTFEFEDFDCGGEGYSFHDSDRKDEGASNYRRDNSGLDIGKGNDGYVVGYTASGEWMEYTVNVAKAGKYKFEAVVSAGLDGASFSIGKVSNGYLTDITGVIDVPNTGDWNKYTTVSGTFTKRLNKGEQVLRVTVTGSYANLDKITIESASTGIDDIEMPGEGIYDVFSTTGVYMGQCSIDDDVDVSAVVYGITAQKGVFILRDIATGGTFKVAAH